MEGQSLLKEGFYRFLTLCGPLKAFFKISNFFNLKLSCLLFSKKISIFLWKKRSLHIAIENLISCHFLPSSLYFYR